MAIFSLETSQMQTNAPAYGMRFRYTVVFVESVEERSVNVLDLLRSQDTSFIKMTHPYGLDLLEAMAISDATLRQKPRA